MKPELYSHVCGYLQRYIGTIFSRKPGIFNVASGNFPALFAKTAAKRQPTVQDGASVVSVKPLDVFMTL